jgi:DNA polymerase
MSYKTHKADWENCQMCSYADNRRRVVFHRGAKKAPILFIGEAPGISEDVLGKPFVGPAGKLLDRIIEIAIDGQYDYAITNLVGCLPSAEDGRIGQPSEESINTCFPRLVELVQLVQPRMIVLLGKLSQKYIYGQAQFDPLWFIGELHFLDLPHPAGILRLPKAIQEQAVQRSIRLLEYSLPLLEQDDG